MTENRRPMVEHRGGKATIAGTGIYPSIIQDFVDAGYRWDGIRRNYPALADWTDAELAEVATYPRVFRRMEDGVGIDDGGSVEIEGYFDVSMVPVIIDALRLVEAQIRLWRDECRAWEAERAGGEDDDA